MKSIEMVLYTSEKNGEKKRETRYMLCSIDSISKFAKAVRRHWSIQSMYWILDVTVNEEA